ncbi:hypothetical protein KGY71_01395 [Candidatus Bipolaricaulota bacterium]|nr:hypothetical protein [Candidatus Bipolaricaulota bacterium]
MKLRSALLALLVLFILLVSVYPGQAGTTLGLSLENDYTNDSLFYGGYLRTGGLFKIELGGLESTSETAEEIDLFSYFLADLTLGRFGTNGSLHLYLGGSPVMTLDTETPSFAFSSSSAYGKIGLQFDFFPFSVQAQTTGELDFNGDLERIMGGIGFGLSF